MKIRVGGGRIAYYVENKKKNLTKIIDILNRTCELDFSSVTIHRIDVEHIYFLELSKSIMKT